MGQRPLLVGNTSLIRASAASRQVPSSIRSGICLGSCLMIGGRRRPPATGSVALSWGRLHFPVVRQLRREVLGDEAARVKPCEATADRIVVLHADIAIMGDTSAFGSSVRLRLLLQPAYDQRIVVHHANTFPYVAASALQHIGPALASQCDVEIACLRFIEQMTVLIEPR